MKKLPRPVCLALVAAGLLGLCAFGIGQRMEPPFVPAGDFARGLWVGICFGLEILGGIGLISSKANPGRRGTISKGDRGA